MNGVAANLLLHLTSSVRFEGTLNTDLNDITMNLVSVFWYHALLSKWVVMMRSSKMVSASRVDVEGMLNTDLNNITMNLLSCFKGRRTLSVGSPVMQRAACNCRDCIACGSLCVW
jgi:hypothetical protein